jgi:hypothetical protein
MEVAFSALGDAICRFNPIYGQVTSVASQEAFALYRLLNSRGTFGDPLVGLSGAFFEEALPLIDAPWVIAASLDLVCPQTWGQRQADFEGALKFGRALNRIAARDPAVHKLTLEVQHLLKPRSAHLTTELVQRVQAEMAAVSWFSGSVDPSPIGQDLWLTSEANIWSANAGFARQQTVAALLTGLTQPLRLLAFHRRCRTHPSLLCGVSLGTQGRRKREGKYGTKQ